jgi:AcrR family transcriptional regulator
VPKVSPEHLEARKQQILDAAMECFAREGFHRTTMKHIVDESGLSPGAIYKYFSSKDQIIDAIARERHAQEHALLSSVIEEDDKAQSLQQLARAFFANFAGGEYKKARRVGVEVWAEALRNPEVLKTVRRGVDEPRKLLARIVTRCQERDEIPSHIDADDFARVIIAIFHGFVLQQAWDSRIEAHQFLAIIDCLLDALAAPQVG